MATKTRTTKTTKTTKPATEQTETFTREAIVDRVRKLLALAARPGTPEEAALAAERAAEIALKYNVQQSELEASQQEAYISNRTVHGEYVANCKMSLERDLMNAVAHNTFCRVVFFKEDNNHCWADVIGQEGNIEIVRYLYTYLIRTIDSMHRSLYRRLLQEQAIRHSNGDYDEEPLPGESKHCRSFRMGAIDVVRARLAAQRREAETAPITGEATMALVVHKDAEVEEALARLYPNLRSLKKGRGIGDQSAYFQGMEAGHSIALNKAVKDGKTNGKALPSA